MASHCAVREPILQDHGGAMPNPVNPVNPVQKTAERMASHCAVREPERRNHGGATPNPVNPVEKRPNAWLCTARFANRGYRIHGGAMPNPVNPVNPVEKRPNAWRRTARFANRNDGIMAVQRLILLILSILSKNVRTHGVALRGSRTDPTGSWRCNAQSC
jgi:hypothetical protein